MDRPLKLWEFLIGVIGIVITCATFVYNIGSRDTTNRIEINNLKERIGNLQDELTKSKVEMSKQGEAINGKLDKLNESLVDLKVIIQNKQDRR